MIPKKEWARDTLRMLLLLGAAVAVCSVLSRVHDDNNPFAVLIFVLAVAIVALVTNGYVWGVLASVIGVFCVNYMFTYPFWSFDMSITGYPLTFVVLLVVSVVISTLTTRAKQTERRGMRSKAKSCGQTFCGRFPTICAHRSPPLRVPTACCWSSPT